MDLRTYSSILLLVDVEENPRVMWANSMERGDGLLRGMKEALGGSLILLDVATYPKVKNPRGNRSDPWMGEGEKGMIRNAKI